MKRSNTLLLMIMSAISMMAGIRVTDAEDGTAINGATVMSRSGLILGITNSGGEFSGYSNGDFPLTIRCLGYNETVCPSGETEVKMTTKDYQLPEYTVTADGHPIGRMVCYGRTYASFLSPTDTIQSYSDMIFDVFYADKKVKSFKHADKKQRSLLSKRILHHSNDQGIDSISTKPGNLPTFNTLMTIPPETLKESESIANGNKEDSIPGKYGIKKIQRKTQSGMYVNTDQLADNKGHVMSPWFLKLLGMTMDITEFVSKEIYRPTDSGIYQPEDLVLGSYSIQGLIKGKLFKKIFHTDDPIELSLFSEYYPLSIEYLTAEEAKELYDNPPTYRLEDYTDIPNLSPLPESVQTLIERAENEGFDN